VIAFARRLGVLAILILAFASTLAIAALATPAFLLHEKTGHRLHRFWGRLVCALFGIRVRFYYLHNLPRAGTGAVLASNHQSMFDMPILACLPADYKWVSKAQLRAIPFLGWGMQAMGTFFVTRTRSAQDADVLKGAAEGLRRGKQILIFPEGTRSRDGALQPLKKGAFRLAQTSGTPLVPIAISGSHSIAAPKRLPKHWGHEVTVRIGLAIHPTADEPLEALQERYRRELTRLLEENSPPLNP